MSYQVLKRHVPPGAMIADCAAEQLYFGDEIAEAIRASADCYEEIRALPASTENRGQVVIDTYRDGERCSQRIATMPQTRLTPPVHGPGYPAHRCGSPMSPPAAVPAIVASQLAGPAGVRLYCAGCCAWVSATADERLRALNAYAAERGA